MNTDHSNAGSELPTAKVVKRKLRFSFVWTIPLLAFAIAGYLVYEHAREFGPAISIQFRDVAGIRPGRTIVQYRGAEIGKVDSIALSSNHQHAVVKVRLRRELNSLAREGTSFWIVSPQLGLGNITGLGTIVSGAYIELSPGHGQPATEFIAVEHSPKLIDPQGRHVILRTDNGGSIRAGVPIYYRGVEVGAVKETRLSQDAAAVEIHGVIRERYSPLVTPESKFWNVTGMDVKVGLFRGAEINVESLKSLILGGIAFATPERSGNRPARDGMIFQLHDEPHKDWLKWSPAVQIPPENAPAY